MQAATREMFAGAEKGAVAGAALVVLFGAIVVAAAIVVQGRVDLGVVQAHWVPSGREFVLDLKVSALMWAVPVLGAGVGVWLARGAAERRQERGSR